MTEKDYNECVTQYADNVYRFIVKNIRQEEDAKDIVQTAFEKLWKNREQIISEKSKSYLFTVVYHQMIDHIRKNKRILLQEDFKQDIKIDYQQHNKFSKEAITNALYKLNEVQRSLITLKDYEGYSYEEIGEIMQLNSSQVKVYLHRARLALRNYIVKPENII
ncbi:MAG: RNA polymerase sigma factor [Chitinophagales bacterium]|nr:RNA polymerase sigma factor [Chitinophagales bacterium]